MLPAGVDRSRRRMLVLDSSYSLEAIRSKHLEASVLCRDLDGYFDEVVSVHPFATLVTSPAWSPRYGRPVVTRLSDRHIFIEGKVGRYEWLAGIPFLNFLFAQADVLWSLVVLARRKRVSVVRAGDPLLLGLYGWVIARLARVPLAVRIGGNNEKVRRDTGRPLMPRLLFFAAVERAIEQFVLTRADLVAAANEDNLRFAIGMGARPDRSTVFRYGNLIHAAHFMAPELRADAADLLAAIGAAGRPFLLYVGRLEPVKMPDHVVRTLASVRTAGHDVALVIAGTGRMEAELRALAGELGVAADVIFAGERDQEWLARVIPRAALVLSPHTGRALSEVALGAAPVVAYDLDWQAELIRTDVTGALVPAGNVAAMAAAAAGLLADREKAARLGAALRLEALEMMDRARLDDHERSAYDRLLDR